MESDAAVEGDFLARQTQLPEAEFGEHPFIGLDRASSRISTRSALGPLRWRAWGRGRAIVLLHGGSGSWLHWASNIAALAETHRVLVPDMPGFGDSAQLRPGCTGDVAACIADGIDELQLGAFALVGFSFGTLVGAKILERATACSHVVLVGSYALGPKNRLQARMQRWRSLPADATRTLAHSHNLATLMIHDADRIDRQAIAIQTRNAEAALSGLETDDDAALLPDALGRWTGRVSAVWGELDAVTLGHLDTHLHALQAVSPGVRMHVVPQAGHWVQYEAADAVNRWLVDEIDRPFETAGSQADVRERP